MENEVIVAYVAGAFSVIATAISVFAAGRVVRANDEAGARRSYEYEARKRLYQDVEPLLFQLETASIQAQDGMFNLARAARDGKLGAHATSWLADRGYYHASRMYSMLYPSALYRLIELRLTSLDLSLDRRKAMVFALLKEYERALGADFNLAQCEPAIAYDPNDQSELPTSGGGFRQGLVAGRKENCVEAMILRQPGENPRVRLFGEFETALEGELGPRMAALGDILFQFHPDQRPVFWRVLLLKAVLARVIHEVLEDGRRNKTPMRALKRLQRDQRFREALRTTKEIPAGPEPLDVVFAYIEPNIRRIERRLKR